MSIAFHATKKIKISANNSENQIITYETNRVLPKKKQEEEENSMKITQINATNDE